MIIEFFDQDAATVVNNRVLIRFSDRINGKWYDYFKSIPRAMMQDLPRLQQIVRSMANGIKKSRSMIYRLKNTERCKK